MNGGAVMYLEMKDVTKRIRGTTVVDKVGFTMENSGKAVIRVWQQEIF